MSSMKVVTDATWHDDVLHSQGLVLVDLWAPWCGPCKAMLPSYTELAQEYDGELAFAKLNVEDNKQTAEALKVRGIPLLVMFKDGIEVARIQGGSKSSIAAFIDINLGLAGPGAQP